MTKFAAILLGVVLMLSGCNGSKEKETPKGFKFQIVQAGDNVPAKKSQVIIFNAVMKDSKDSVWFDTYKNAYPGIFYVKDSVISMADKGFPEMFMMLSKGDSAEVKLPIKEFFVDHLHMPVPPGVDSTLNITYSLRIKDIMSEENFRNYQAELIKSMREKQKSEDDTLIKDYLAKNSYKAERDTTGIYYTIHANQGKNKPTETSCVTVSYKGALLEDGKVFDQNQNVSFSLAQVIPGWRIAIPKLGIGDSATFYIPSELAYGPRGAQGAIPPNAVLVFDVRLEGMGGEFDPQTGKCK